MSHTTSITEGKYKLVVIHNGDWSGNAEVTLLKRKTLAADGEPIANFEVPGTLIVKLAVEIVSVGVERFLTSTLERIFGGVAPSGTGTTKGLLLQWIMK